MKRCWAAPVTALLLAVVPFTAAQDVINPEELLKQAGEWVEENIDDSALDALGVDKTWVEEFLRQLQQRLQSTSVYDLASLGETARQLQPLLASFEETAPYAAWLATHLDDFSASEQLRREVLLTATNRTSLPPPSPELQRSVWTKVITTGRASTATNRYLPVLKKIFNEERVPPELVWVAQVESSFDPRARSPAGAVGLFQLMPVTAREQQLTVNLLRDERTHPEKSARAAARYLRQLHQRFGDWRLALAAYNCGETRVANLLKRRGAKTYEAISAHLPTETQMYVPKLEATLRKYERKNLRDLPPPR